MSTKPCFSDNRCEASLNVTGVAADVDTADDGVSHDGDEQYGKLKPTHGFRQWVMQCLVGGLALILEASSPPFLNSLIISKKKTL